MTTLSCPFRAFAACIFLLLSPLAAALAPTSPGFPDPTYGSGGALTFGLRPGYESASVIVPTPDGRWLVSGSASDPGFQNTTRYLMRLQPDGRPDLSFGTNGFVMGSLTSGAMSVQPSGKILAAGITAPGGGIFRGVLRRLASNGSRDFNFGVDSGQTLLGTQDAQVPNQQIDSLDQDAQGRIVVSTRVYASGYTTSRIEVWRFSAEGIPDATFGNGGGVQVADLPPVAYNSVVRAQADGKVVVATWCAQINGGQTELCVIRFNADGTRDAGFGPNGLRKLTPPAGISYPIYDLKIAADGKVYIAGTNFGNGAVALVVRLNSDGTPDAGYGQGGLAKINFTGETAYVFHVHLLPDGRQIAIGGVQVDNVQLYGFTARFTPSGQLDTTFGNAGVSPRVSEQPHWFDSGAVLADGAILGVGQLQTAPGSDDNKDSLLARIVGVETTSAVTEFFNTILNHYFVTADPVEGASIDAGASGPGWIRTGKSFKSGGPSRVCRLYGSPEINPATGLRRGPNSHVYSIEAAECLAIRADPGWRFESYDFSGWLRTAATCPAGTIGVYRAYNNRFAQNDSNHRYTIEIAVYNEMLALGWIGEGIVFCVVQ